MPRRRSPLQALLAPALAALAAACADDSAGDGWGGGPPDPTDPPTAVKLEGGPLASAGPDRQVLEGEVVRLDATGSRNAESGRPLRYLWTLERADGGADRLTIDDPASPVIRVAAPVLPFPGLGAGGSAEAELRLTVDDGVERSVDRMRLVLKSRRQASALAPVVSAGPDHEAAPESRVVLGPASAGVLDPACEGVADCPAPEVSWTQVEGPPAAPQSLPPESGCAGPCASVTVPKIVRAPGDRDYRDVETVLTYRVEARSAKTGLRSAPDHVRIFVRTRRPFTVAPHAEVGGADFVAEGAWLVPSSLAKVQYKAIGSFEELAATALGFRPVLGEAGLHEKASPSIPRPDAPQRMGWTFEGRTGRVQSAPAFLLVDWRMPAPVADAGVDPVRGDDTLLAAGDPVRLDGTGSELVEGGEPIRASCEDGRSHPELEFRWFQTHGPAVLDDPTNRCDPAATGTRPCDSDLVCPEFVAPTPKGQGPLYLAFELRVRRRGAEPGPWSPADTVVVRIGPTETNEPPVVRVRLLRPDGGGELVPLDGPVDEASTVVVDASGTTDPEGLPLVLVLEGTGPAALEVTPRSGCALPGACFDVALPRVTAPTEVTLRLVVRDGVHVTVCGEGPPGDGTCLDADGAPLERLAIAVRDSENEPPVPEVPAHVVAAAGGPVRIDASGTTDPNDDPLTFAWTVLAGDARLDDPASPAPSFPAPAADADAEVRLRLRVEDARGAVAETEVRVTVLAHGPYVAPGGDDAAAGTADAPVGSLARALALAEALGLPAVLAAEGEVPADGAEGRLRIDAEVRGGHRVAGAVWSADGAPTGLPTATGLSLSGGLSRVRVSAVPGAPEVLVRAGGGAHVADATVDATGVAEDTVTALAVEGAGVVLEGVAVVAGGRVDGTGLRCGDGASFVLRPSEAGAPGAVSGGAGAGLRTGVLVEAGCAAELAGAAIRGAGGVGATTAVAVRVAAGGSLLAHELPLVDSGPATGEAIGIDAPGGLSLVNADVIAGPAATVAGLRLGGAATVHSSRIALAPASPGAAIELAGSGATLQNLVVDAGAAAGRCHVKAGASATATVERVLLAADPGCGADGAYLCAPDPAPACTAAALAALAGWDALVAAPLYEADGLCPAATSPAVDAGTAAGAPATDLRGTPRGRDGNGDGVDGFDLGPCER